jgi:hypothetical protein
LAHIWRRAARHGGWIIVLHRVRLDRGAAGHTSSPSRGESTREFQTDKEKRENKT